MLRRGHEGGAAMIEFVLLREETQELSPLPCEVIARRWLSTSQKKKPHLANDPALILDFTPSKIVRNKFLCRLPQSMIIFNSSLIRLKQAGREKGR